MVLSNKTTLELKQNLESGRGSGKVTTMIKQRLYNDAQILARNCRNSTLTRVKAKV